ncbi:AAA family ATPase [Aureimonas sp. AU40]|uniref:AAA family ATPase n=1 Tax=Aureimonas sp. AU40 TaxID=1637747 RepID=UPI0007820B65|nr:AAA family ATPase [Aureimonas sp. AU40]
MPDHSPDEFRLYAQRYLRDVAARAELDRRILAGEPPALEDVLSGHPPTSGSLALDVRGFAILWAEFLRTSQSHNTLSVKLLPLVEKLEVVPAAATIRAVWKHVGALPGHHTVFPPHTKTRLAWYAALVGCDGAAAQILSIADPLATVWRRAYSAGLASNVVFADPINADADFQNQILGAGILELATQAEQLSRFLPFVTNQISAEGILEFDDQVPEHDALDDADTEEAFSIVKELRSGAPAALPTHQVLRPVDGHKTSEKRDISKMYQALTAPMPLHRFTYQHTPTLERQWPHAVSIIRAIASELRYGQPIRFKPVLLVGGPGTGKTSLAIAIAELLGLRTIIYPCASSADNSFGGTPSRWSTASASTPLELIRQSGIANPIVILDEIEKAGNHRSGNLEAALLPFLEPHTSSRYHETALDMSADLSQVNYIATCNSLDGLTAPLRDRFRILRMPDPGPEHIGTLVRRIVEDIALETGQEGLLPPLDPDEEDVLRRIWTGGSLRSLRRAVDTMITVRSKFEVRQ